MTKNLFIAFSGIILLSCKQEDEHAAGQVRALNTSDTFRLDMPPRKNHLDTVFYQLFKKEEMQVGLESIENGFDSLQLRVWYGGQICGNRVIVLTHDKRKWSAKVIEIEVEIKGIGQRYEPGELLFRTRFTGTAYKKSPRSGWRTLIRKLFESEMLTMPDMRMIKDLVTESVSDGEGVLIEVSAKKVYRAYVFHNPGLYAGKNKTAKNIKDIVLLLEAELGLEDLCDLQLKKNAAEIDKIKPQQKNGKVVTNVITTDDTVPHPGQ